MSKGYALKHSHIAEVSRGTSDPSPPSMQHGRNIRQVGPAQKNIVRDGCKHNADCGQLRVMSSPISSLSPLHSSNSSDVLSHSGSNYQCDSDMYNSEINSSGCNGSHEEINLEESSATGSEQASLSFEQSLKALNLSSRVKSLLITCAAALSEAKMNIAEKAMQDIRTSASVLGDPLERLAAYMSEGLVARLHASGSTIYRSLKCREAPAIEVLSAMEKLYEICPYIQFAFMAANGAIAEAFREEPMVHVFDFQIDQGTQWFSLIQVLASRPGGPPCMRISTIDDPSAHSYPLGGLDAVKSRLASFASSLGVPFEFTIISSKLSDLQASMIERKAGEALAINFALQLHHMPDESVRLDNPRDRIIRLCKSLNPKVLTLVEQDANTNTAPFVARFVETLDYYSAVFESIDVALPRESKDRVNVEEHCLARDIVNVIACEGVERVERHEVAGKWRARMLMAGFKPHPLSLCVNSAIKSLLESYNEQYRLKEDGEILLLGWKSRFLLAASAWH
ncbi:hypothetical protein L7F22_021373 [Adiantum nelumboides]|nr:hypothetical protein [Adiantum nelumboides]